MINVDKNTFLDINLKAINKNYKIIKQIVGRKCIIAATVKANAYGLGADQVVDSLIKKGCKYFFVATTNEAIFLRKLNKRIFIFIYQVKHQKTRNYKKHIYSRSKNIINI